MTTDTTTTTAHDARAEHDAHADAVPFPDAIGATSDTPDDERERDDDDR